MTPPDPAHRGGRWGWAAAAALCLVPFTVDLLYKAVVHPRPFWVFYYDPEGIYYFGGFRLLAGDIPWNADNPGAPVYALSAAVLAVLRLDVADFDRFRMAAYLVGWCATAAGLAAVMGTFLRAVPFPLRLAAGLAYFCCPYSLQCNAVWSPETLYAAAGAVVVVALHRASVRGFRGPQLAALGLALGLACSVKFTMLAWAVGGVAATVALTDRSLAARVRAAVTVGGGIVAGFVAATAWVIPRYGYMFSWLTKLATRSGTYGGGEAAAPQATTALANVAEAVLSAKGFYLAVAVCGLLAAHRLWVRPGGRAGDRFLFLFAAVAFALTHLMVTRTMTLRYVLPAGTSGLVLIGLAARLALAGLPRPAQWAICAAVAVMAGRHVAADAGYHDWRLTTNLALHDEIGAAVRAATAATPDPVVVYAFQCPQPSLALRIETFSAEEQRAIDALYPREGYVTWSDQIVLPEGVRRWDLLVIREAELRRLKDPVGRKVGQVRDYGLYEPPAR